MDSIAGWARLVDGGDYETQFFFERRSNLMYRHADRRLADVTSGAAGAQTP